MGRELLALRLAVLLSLAGGALAWTVPVHAAPGVDQQAKFKAQGHEENIQEVVSLRWDERVLINYIRDVAPDTPVPGNYILAAGVSCSGTPNFGLRIWDTQAEAVVVTPNPISFAVVAGVPSSKKDLGRVGSKQDAQVEASITTSSSDTIEFSGVMQFTYKRVPKKLDPDLVCPIKGKSLSLTITLDHPVANAVLTGKLKLGKALRIQ